MPLDPKIPHQEPTYEIIGEAMRVHSPLGPGLKELHYQRDLIAELRSAGYEVEEEYFVEIWDGDTWLGRLYLDVLVNSFVVVECKSFPHMLTDEEIAQVILYLAVTGLSVGLLFNFGRRRLEYRRILPPRVLDGWQMKVGRFLWRPESAGPVPVVTTAENVRVVRPDPSSRGNSQQSPTYDVYAGLRRIR
jgi:GxxExxY protein